MGHCFTLHHVVNEQLNTHELLYCSAKKLFISLMIAFAIAIRFTLVVFGSKNLFCFSTLTSVEEALQSKIHTHEFAFVIRIKI